MKDNMEFQKVCLIFSARRLPLDLEGRFEIKRLLGDGNTALVRNFFLNKLICF